MKGTKLDTKQVAAKATKQDTEKDMTLDVIADIMTDIMTDIAQQVVSFTKHISLGGMETIQHYHKTNERS